MAKYYILSNGQKFKVSMSDITDYTMMDNLPTEDIIHYTVNLNEGEWEGTISAWIENPSQHTLYLISQGRCYITVNCRNFIGHSACGYHVYQEWNPNDPRKTNPNWRNMTHSSGLGRGSYRFHKYWSLCLSSESLLNNDDPIKVTNAEEIEIPIHFTLANRGKWYGFANVKGHAAIEYKSDKHENPYRDTYYYDIRLALLTACQQDTSHWIDRTRLRVYQTKSKITRITFER